MSFFLNQMGKINELFSTDYLQGNRELIGHYSMALWEEELLNNWWGILYIETESSLFNNIWPTYFHPERLFIFCSFSIPINLIPTINVWFLHIIRRQFIELETILSPPSHRMHIIIHRDVTNQIKRPVINMLYRRKFMLPDYRLEWGRIGWTRAMFL